MPKQGAPISFQIRNSQFLPTGRVYLQSPFTNWHAEKLPA